jgi:hypothetical protein
MANEVDRPDADRHDALDYVPRIAVVVRAEELMPGGQPAVTTCEGPLDTGGGRALKSIAERRPIKHQTKPDGRFFALERTGR